jgi:PAS domain S-box-containing protein
MKYILLSIFIILNILVYFVTSQNVEGRIKDSLYTHLHNLQIHYEVLISSQSSSADIIYNNTIANQDEIISILQKAWETKDEKQRDYFRNLLYERLKDKYEFLKQQGIFQFHFVFPDNISFLRMHKVSKYGDDLSQIRGDFKKVNETKSIVKGFSQGIVLHAFRNVYPIFNKNGKYIGAVEVSYPSEILQKSLNIVSEIHSHFLINKKILPLEASVGNSSISKFAPSIEHKDFVVTLIKRNKKDKHVKAIKERIELLRDTINQNIQKGDMFSLMSKIEDDIKIISFLPVYQNTTYETVAWIVSYVNDDFLIRAHNNANFIRVSSFLILTLLMYFVYRIVKQSETLSKLLKSYDKNVIFSTTDLDGKITHASEAFCKISGYSEKELLGRSHSIIKSDDMPSSVYEDMWETIVSGKVWKGEIKNKTKNGKEYWVDAEVEPTFNADGKIIGYNSLRHDITDRKDIESIQEEIIFTMGTIGELRDKDTGNHVKRVAEYSKVLALHYGLGKEEAELLKQASPMHDIGKVAIADSVLNKPAKLDFDERKVMESHAKKGYELLNVSERPLLNIASIIAHEHHEKWDGSGYPRGLKGKDIHIYGRITAIADVFDALSMRRCYKEPWSDEEIFELFRKERGKHFDPKLIDIFFKNIDEFLRIRKNLCDQCDNIE